MDRSRLLGYPLTGGFALTPVTGSVPHRTLMGATHHGFPMAWMMRRVHPAQYVPMGIDGVSLVVDVLVRTAVVLLVRFDRFGTGTSVGQRT